MPSLAGERASLAQREAHRLEVAGRHDLPVAGRALIRRRRVALDVESPIAHLGRERQQPNRGRPASRQAARTRGAGARPRTPRRAPNRDTIRTASRCASSARRPREIPGRSSTGCARCESSARRRRRGRRRARSPWPRAPDANGDARVHSSPLGRLRAARPPARDASRARAAGRR